MSSNADFVIVRRSCLDHLWLHCHGCPDFSEQARAFLREHHVVIPCSSPPEEQASKRRKELPPPRPFKPSEPKPTKKKDRASHWFLQSAPKASEWHARQIKIVGNAANYEAVIRSLAHHSEVNTKEDRSQEYLESENELVAIGVKLALLAHSSLKNGDLQKSFSHFQVFLFLSYCGLLEARGVPYETLDMITQYVSCFREMDRRRLRSQALRINLLIQELVKGGWSIYRATELFFLNSLSPTYFLSIDEEGFRRILEGLTTDEYVRHDFSDCLRPEYTVPGLVTHMIHAANTATTLTIRDIGIDLGYDAAIVPKSIDRIHKVQHPAKSKLVAPIPFVYFTSPESFRNIATVSSCSSTSREVHGATWPGKDYASMSRSGSATGDLLKWTIPPLFHAMGGRIPKALLYRAACSQRRVDKCGKIYEVTPHDAGLDQDLVHFLHATRLKQSIEHLISLSIIGEEESVYVCQDGSAQVLFEQSRDYWIRQAFMLCCYVFPRKPIIDSSFSSGGELLGILRHLLGLYAETGLELPSCSSTAETLLSAAQFGGLSDRENLLKMAASLQPNPHVQAEIVYKLSVVLRFKGRISDSKRVITEFLSRLSLDLTQESHYFLGLLHLSQANNQACLFDFCGAREETRNWRPSSDTLSDCELRLLADQLCCNGRILKGEGRFDEARCCFEGCLATTGLPKPKRLLIISHLSDLYCELDYIQRKNACQSAQSAAQSIYLDKGKAMVEREIECVRACGRPLRSLRRLLLSLIELEIRQGHLDKAECLIKEILDIYNRLTEPDINDRVGHVRSLIGRARLSPLCEAEEHWTAALLQNKIYNPLEEEVFTCGLIYLHVSSIRFQLEDVDGSRDTFKQAIQVIGSKRPQFLMPGVGTYLFDSVRLDLQSRAGWILPKIAQ